MTLQPLSLASRTGCPSVRPSLRESVDILRSTSASSTGHVYTVG